MAQEDSQLPQSPEITKEPRPTLLTEIQYKPGFEDEAASIPIIEQLEGRPVRLAFTWGKKSRNMSAVYLAEGETTAGNEQRVVDFLTSQGMALPPYIAHGAGGLTDADGKIVPQIINVTKDSLDLNSGKETRIKANILYTKDPDIALIIKPADCPVSVIYAKNEDGEDIVAITHSSGEALNASILRSAITHFIDEEGVDVKTIKIGILPGVGKAHFIMPENNDMGEIIPWSWGEYIDKERRVDVVRATILQYEQARVGPDNIEAYDIDTYTAAQEGLTYSDMLHVDRGQEVGRFLVAAQLNKPQK